MKKTFKILILLLVMILVPTQTVAAQGLSDGPVIFGGTYTLDSDEHLEGDIVVFGGIVMIEENAEVDGSVVVFGGTLTINGEVYGDVVLIGGAVMLGEESLIDGDLSVVGATLSREEGAEVTGDVIYNSPGFHTAQNPFTPTIPDVPGIPDVPFVEQTPIVVHTNPVWAVVGVLGRSIAMGLLAMLLALFLEEPTRRISDAVVKQPVIAGGLGFLTISLAPFVLLVLVITIFLAPVAFLVALALVVALLYGWVALGMEIGQRFTKMLKQDWAFPLTAAFGTWLLTIISDSINLIPCVGWLAPFIIVTLALGGIVMTRFGTQAALPPGASAVPTPAAVAKPLPSTDGNGAEE
jgi:cytoskeletal protein CcmA (bactofilin family)